MGLLFSKIWRRMFNTNREFKLIIVGLANAGKTTILYRFHLGKVISTQPTIGSNVEEVRNKNVRLQVWDLGGQETLRSVWSTYFSGTDGIIFVVDSSDEKNELISKMELFKLLESEDLRGAAILVYANKQDVPGAMNAAEITEKMSLTQIKDREWQIQACSAKEGTGLQEGLDWITDKIINKTKK